MPWSLLRVTADLTDDPTGWRGIDMAAPTGAPAETIFMAVGRGGAKVDSLGRVAVRIGWLNAAQQPVAGAGTSLTAEPMTIDPLLLPLPSGTTQTMRIVSVGAAQTAAAWHPLFLDVGGAALASVRLSTMVFASATRVGVWFWT